MPEDTLHTWHGQPSREQLVAEVRTQRERIGALETALEAAKIEHYACYDTYYECPVGRWEADQRERAADEGRFHVYAVGDPRPDCTCDADAHNAAIDRALKGEEAPDA